MQLCNFAAYYPKKGSTLQYLLLTSSDLSIKQSQQDSTPSIQDLNRVSQCSDCVEAQAGFNKFIVSIETHKNPTDE